HTQGSSPVDNEDMLAAQRADLLATIRNIFEVGENMVLSADEIHEAVFIDTTHDPYRIERKLPIVIALRADIYTTCPVERKPFLMVFTGEGIVADAKLILDVGSQQGLACEVTRLARSMESKNPIWEVPYHGKKTAFAIQDRNNWVALAVMYGPEELYRQGNFMCKGGDRMTRVGIKDHQAEEEIYLKYANALVVARLLGFSLLAGPDVMCDVDRRMGLLVDQVKATVIDINTQAIEDHRITPIDTATVLRPTTSTEARKGGFSHMRWMVTSLSVVVGTLTAARWVYQAKQTPKSYPQEVGAFLHALNIDFSQPLSCIIQGFGDVGSGISQLLIGQFRQFGVQVRGFSNRNFAIYCEKGLPVPFLSEVRQIVEEESPDALTVERLLRMNSFDVSLRGTILWIAGTDSMRGQFDVLTKDLAARDITVYSGDAAIVDELIYQKAMILFLAALANVIREKKQVERLQVSILSEGGNNTIAIPMQPELKKRNILYLPGELLNGGGSYTSRDEIRHNHVDGLGALLREPGYYYTHITDEIAMIALHRIIFFLERWAASEGNFALDISYHVGIIASEIFAATDRLIIDRNPRVLEFAQIDQERTLGRLPLRHSLGENAIQIAQWGILFRKEEVSEKMGRLRQLLCDALLVRESGATDNYEICLLRYYLFVLGKMSY
ncbi:MAG: hypothetical protein KKC84_01545, partial [Candidatus Omnitrophica bacterium]|nr:hypothetical protein [Candidatus Omnitrophota bacterium]